MRDQDLVLIWTPNHKCITPGTDVLGGPLRRIAQRELANKLQ